VTDSQNHITNDNMRKAVFGLQALLLKSNKYCVEMYMKYQYLVKNLGLQ